jgi:ABC-type branched-subunit amino acid transport system substrate-binding protein
MAKKLLIVLTLLVCVVAILITSNRFIVRSQTSKSIRFVGSVPLTGPAAAFSGQYPNGFRMGIQDACFESQLDQAIFYVDFQDNAMDPTRAVSILQQHAASGFDVYLTGLTPPALAVAPQLSESGKAHFVIAFDAFITSEHQDLFRILPHFKAEGPLWTQYAVSRDADRVFIIHSNFRAYHDQYSRIVEPDLAKANIIFAREVYEPGTSEFRTLAMKAKNFAPDVVFISSLSPDLLPLIEALRQQSMTADGMIMTTMDFTDLLYTDVEMDRLRGVAFACPEFELTINRGRHQDWRDRYQAKNGRLPSYVEAYAYDTAQILVATYLNRGGVSPADIRVMLPFEGITGTIHLDENDDLIGTVTVARVSDENEVIEIDLPR